MGQQQSKRGKKGGKDKDNHPSHDNETHADEPNGLGPVDPVPAEAAPPGDVLPIPAEGPEVPEQSAVGAPAEDVEMADG